MIDPGAVQFTCAGRAARRVGRKLYPALHLALEPTWYDAIMDVAPVRIENLMGRTAVPPNNLPAALTGLIGRDKEIATLRQLMQRAEVRLVTLTGPGGVGKPRPALQGAGDLLWDFADGVYFVD